MLAKFILAAMLGILEVGCDLWKADGSLVPDAPDGAPMAHLPSDGGPPIQSAPDAWAPSNCGGVGNLCSMSCDPAGQCQIGLDVCVPMAGAGGFPAQSPETPYCLAATCMTYEQASCFCKGAAGSQFSNCALGPQAVVGLCGTEGTSCSSRPCCGGFKCVKDTPSTGTCYKTCQTGADCSSNCCTDLKSTGDLECAPATACASPCTQQGNACTNSIQCCNGTCVTSTTNPDFAGCRPSCTTNSDCASSCCRMFSNAPGGFCVSAAYCNCTPVGADCTNTQNCCAGSTCGAVNASGTQYSCLQNCMGAGDCDGGCCSTYIPGTNHGTCSSTCM